MKISYFLILYFFLLSLPGKAFLDDTCEGDWEPFKNEKCLKVLDSQMESYDDAESYCKTKYDANLVSIGLEEKQKFLENFLKSKAIFNEVWIGLKYESDDNYVWSDDTIFHYSNWGAGSPKNDPTHCVQISTDEAEFGKWIDVPCTKKNIVLCEKVQPWSLAQIQNEVMNIKQNLIPIGFMYVQLPKEKPPSEIWPWMIWADVSLDYAGFFFRVEGGNSSSFGTVQEQTSPRITYIESYEAETHNNIYDSANIYPDNQLSHIIHTASQPPPSVATYRGLRFRQSDDEVRPRNLAIRIWKRTQ